MDRVARAIEVAQKSRHLNALITETFDLAQRQCKNHIAEGRSTFNVVVKDNFAVRDVPMTCASRMLANYKAPYTATVVERLVDNGGCVIGKANMDEFAMGSTNVDSYFGPAKNPKTPIAQMDGDFFVAGGSSGGCAVAISEGFADVAIGSDTGGSTRNPASFNGVCGFKPSYGLLSRYGLVPLVNSFDSPSLFTRDVNDCMKYFDQILGRDEKDCTTLNLKDKNIYSAIESLQHVKVGVPMEFRRAKMSEDCRRIWHKAIDSLASAGAQVKDVKLPHTPYSVVCYHILNQSDVFSNMSRYDGIEFGHRENQRTSFNELMANSRTKALNDVVRKRIFAGNYFNLEENKGRYFLQAAKIRRLIQSDFAAAFQDVDVLILPSTNHSAPTISQVRARSAEENQNEDFFTQSANMCGLPAISIPFGECSNGLPLGVQLIGDYLNDWTCMKVGSLFQGLR
ncbi:hypothetical protein M3Y94_00459300 [Aphelenchoides besseyi]|nr:hypothetical protein M3Y94_00459300 [Aphelenchoides besseyi]KAI6229229.1 Glutamyl-tRNA(Gln) amidotransferase subunit A, mitochondrial [Aphelenchoides besseyi]